MKRKFEIEVMQTVPDEDLDIEDREESPIGKYTIIANSEDEALDEFHATVPISCLEHFDITINQAED